MQHLSARLAWHDNGWNGHLCKEPKKNIYCSGRYSFPGDMIGEYKDVDLEEGNNCKNCNSIDFIPPCCYSINAFGKESVECYATPPEFFRDDTEEKHWELPPASVCTWCYEEMYKDEVKLNGKYYDPKKRSQAMEEYYSQFEKDKSLIFYYTNYDNPFSGEEKKYVLVGVSRLKEILPTLKWENQGDESYEKYGNLVWARVVQSTYPDEGFRIPYENYMDNEEVLSKLVFTPENSRNFKYATRAFGDDDALELIERLIEVVNYLSELDDKTEDWGIRLNWLSSIMAELWGNRGIYPGINSVADYLGGSRLIPLIKKELDKGTSEETIYKEVNKLFEGDATSIFVAKLDSDYIKKLQKQWKYKEDIEQELLANVFPRFALTSQQISKILDEERSKNGIYSSLEDIAENPYIICEEYIGDEPDDTISFSKIDHGIFPSPDFGVEALMDTDDARRLRALLVDALKKTAQHSFVNAKVLLGTINRKLEYMPDWKKAKFTQKYIEVEEDVLDKQLELKRKDKEIYIYLKEIYKLEDVIGSAVKELAARPNLKLKYPVAEKDWENYIYKKDSIIEKRDPAKYRKIVDDRIEMCKRIFQKPICVITGEAGTGKTTIVNAIINAVEKSTGEGTTFQLLAPTGKAAERLRLATGKNAATIHSFLVQRGWMNDNFTFKREGGVADETKKTIIIDECSMLDTVILGTLFKSINFNCVQRIIFVGDHNQLPPIGTGKPFAEIIDYLKKYYPDYIGILTPNIRLIEEGGISLELAQIFTENGNENEEGILQKLQYGGEIDKDLKVIFWKNESELKEKVVSEIISKVRKDGEETEETVRYTFDRLFENQKSKFDRNPDNFQIISPYRNEEYGTESVNQLMQQTFNNYNYEKHGKLGGVTYFDKIIQYINRPKSYPYYAYNFSSRQVERLEVYNGEIGFMVPHAADKLWSKPFFRLSKFQAKFKGKETFGIEFNSDNMVTENVELAYAISVHKAQGSDFDNVYFILPKKKSRLLSKELFYTGITRAKKHTTLFIEDDIGALLSLRRKEASEVSKINSSIMEFNPIPEELLNINEWYEEGKIHRTLADFMVRSKSEVIISNMLFEENIPFWYEKPLYADDGTMYLPDFTIEYNGQTWYWEHLGFKGNKGYDQHWNKKEKWYKNNGFFDNLIVSDEQTGADTVSWKQTLYKKLGKA
ncbi:Exodeoxyribonuclease V [Ruminiclostridium papyrosolvens DSM 2782]|uniref:Exodeoxyribonuclease V n=1 Tax=Ruminiclostridium papyrosolvens DSM 2782 TaxID=588581 RepID=F1THD3_9FIRM|nr:AAA family ATPase [Ruminiclostridium papyrosolvens]EGD46136.1 Exodeoxyribonuclease V [Ruminiclostridium papyrosolvens DSM 2782]WES35921.1 AAA family ATPase [Ruminiclostridium papyrosolvens DSM 2782]